MNDCGASAPSGEARNHGVRRYATDSYAQRGIRARSRGSTHTGPATQPGCATSVSKKTRRNPAPPHRDRQLLDGAETIMVFARLRQITDGDSLTTTASPCPFGSAARIPCTPAPPPGCQGRAPTPRNRETPRTGRQVVVEYLHHADSYHIGL